MSLVGELGRRILMLVRRGRFQRELEEEMRLHLELRREERIASGYESEEARHAAQRRFGNVTRMKEKSYMAWGWEWLETFVQDAGYGMRSMLRTPAITLVALASLVTLVWAFATWHQQAAYVYHGGLLLIATAAHAVTPR